MAAEASNFHPKNKSKKTKTYPQGNAPINENQTENKHFTIDTQKFVLFWLGSVKVKDLRSVVLPSTPWFHDFCITTDWSTLRLGLVTHAAAVADIGDRAGKVGVGKGGWLWAIVGIGMLVRW